MELNLCYDPREVLLACRAALKANDMPYVMQAREMTLVNMGRVDSVETEADTDFQITRYVKDRAAFFNMPVWHIIAIDKLEMTINNEVDARYGRGHTSKEELLKWLQITDNITLP